MQPVERDFGDELPDPVDRLIISLRAYITRAPKKPKKGEKRGRAKDRHVDPCDHYQASVPPSEWVLVFDCETRTTPDQRLRFGAYQLRYKDEIWERGAFYEPEVLSQPEQTLLREVIEAEIAASDGECIRVLTRAEFVEEVFYDRGYAVGAQIAGFNLPFDLSRLAIRHSSARRSMRGGFSLTLSETRPAVAVKHLSQRSALIRFTGTRPEEKGAENNDIDPDAPHETEEKDEPDRGYFVDLKTLAAALTSQSHSLESLSELLNVPTPKEPSEEHGGPLTSDYIRYGLRDVQTTWECFDALAKRFTTFGLEETGLYDLYSEASLGKAYLKTMKITPWRKLQREFPPKIIGHILSAYYGGRAEIHMRRQIVPVIHCDFLSMYPTVCTLMGLWDFVRAKGIAHSDDIKEVRQLVEMPRETLVGRLRHKDGWRDLATLVQVLPDHDLFPVRAQYPESNVTTIGLNFLTAREPIWFTLADVLASKILTGHTPTDEIFSRQGWRGQESCVPGSASRLLPGRFRRCGFLYPERQGKGYGCFEARQGSRRCNSGCERILRRRMSGRTEAPDGNGRDDDRLRRRAARKNGHSPRDPSGTSVRRAVHRASSWPDHPRRIRPRRSAVQFE